MDHPLSSPVLEIDETLPSAPRLIPSLRSNFAWTLAGNLLYAGCQWGMLSVLAKLGSPSIVGQFTLGLAVCAPVFMFTNLQLRALQATDVSAECGFANYFTLRMLATLLGLAAIAVLLPFVGPSPAVRVVVLLVAISKCIECISDVTAGLLQREEQLSKVAISLMIRGCGSVAAFSLAYILFCNLALSVLVMCGVWLAVLLFYDAPNVKALIGQNEKFFRFDRDALKRLATLGLPLGWVATFASLYVNTPRYFIQHYLGLADQGIYASLAYLVVVINLIVVALSVSVTTRLARLFAQRDLKSFVRLLTRLSMLGIVIVAVGVPLAFLVGRPLLCLLYRREYADHVGLLSLLVGVAGVTTIGTFVFCGLTAARALRAQAPVQLAAVVAGLAASGVLVPRYGLIGGGIALLISSITVVLGGIWIMRGVLRANELQPLK